MTKYIYIHEKQERPSYVQLPVFLFKAPAYMKLSNEAKLLYAMLMYRSDLSIRDSRWTDEYNRVYVYYPIAEVVILLNCGRQKAVRTLRELQYAGLVEIKKQGCGKPNCIFPKTYEAVSNTTFKNYDSSTQEV